MTASTRLTLEQFLSIPDFDERRLELIDGHVYEKPVPTYQHGEIAGELYVALRPFGRPAVEARAMIGATNQFGAGSLIPDVAFHRGTPPLGWMDEPPDLVAEILSPGQDRRQMLPKVDTYQRFGVPSVWVVSPEDRTIEVYEDGARNTFGPDDELHSSAVPGLSLRVASLFNPGERT